MFSELKVASGLVICCVVLCVDPKNLFVLRKKCVHVDFVVQSHVVVSQKQNKHFLSVFAMFVFYSFVK